jgi:5-methylcytosine-specific restriction endonuclease McrA
MTKPISRKMAVDCLLGLYKISCGICGEQLFPGDAVQFDHIHADVFDGPHEHQNLRPVHKDCHKKKTATDIKANAKVKRLRGKKKAKPKRAWPERKMRSGKKPWPKRGFTKPSKKAPED